MKSVKDLIAELMPFSDTSVPKSIADEVLERAKEACPKISLSDFDVDAPIGWDLRELRFHFDHMVRLDYFSVVISRRDKDGEDADRIDDFDKIQDILAQRMQTCTSLMKMNGKDLLLFFSDEVLRWFESKSIVLSSEDGVPLSENPPIAVWNNEDD